jgi:sugar (pentulose or hexulose) kinase
MTAGHARYVAVLDVGKTNAKVAVVDLERFAEIASRTIPNHVLQGGPYPHYDTDGMWSFFLDALAAFNRDHPIDAITATTHGAGCALIDANGGLALPILDYEHDGPEAVAANYDTVRPDFSEIGSPRLPGGLNLGAQIFWQERCFPEGFARAAAILMYPQYWSFRLSAVAANEVTSLGAHTDLWNPAARDYSTLTDRCGWRQLFAPLRRASDWLGTIRPEIAAQTGLGEKVRVYCGIHDSNASLLPHLFSRAAPFTVVSTGTWVIAMAIGGKPVRLDPSRDTLLGVNALGDPVPTARFMGGREYAILADHLGGAPTEADVAAVLADNVFHLPSVQAGSGPFMDQKAEWRCSEATPPGQRLAAASFYLALMTATCLELIGADGVTIVEGPFARNELFVRMLAAASGRGVLPNIAGGAGTSLGAALLVSGKAPPPPEGEAIVTANEERWRAYAASWREAVARRTA